MYQALGKNQMGKGLISGTFMFQEEETGQRSKETMSFQVAESLKIKHPKRPEQLAQSVQEPGALGEQEGRADTEGGTHGKTHQAEGVGADSPVTTPAGAGRRGTEGRRG